MTRSRFIRLLKDKRYSYEIEGDRIIVTSGRRATYDDNAYFDIRSIPSGVVFKNGGKVDLESLTSISPGVEFKNGGDVYLRSITGNWFEDWKGNIEGIDSKRLLNVMIKQGMFI